MNSVITSLRSRNRGDTRPFDTSAQHSCVVDLVCATSAPPPFANGRQGIEISDSERDSWEAMGMDPPQARQELYDNTNKIDAGMRVAGNLIEPTPADAVGAAIFGRLLKSLSIFKKAELINEIDPQRLHHMFDNPTHNLDSFVESHGSQEQAFRAIQNAANEAVKNGKLHGNASGILPTGNNGPIIDVGGTSVRLIGGRIYDGQVTISSASRRGL